MSHAIHKTINPPTGVEVCISANFTGERDVNLIVAKSSLLQIFKLPLQKNDEEPKKKIKLQLVAEYSLFGNIESLKAVRYPRSKTDSLLLSFLDAKISLVEWDQANHDLKLVSLHFYENDDKLKEGHIRFSSHPRIRVDPLNKCAATIIYDRQLVVLPLRREAIDPTAPLPDGEEAKRLYPPSYVINLRELGIINVIDIQFLNGYHDPTLVILYESELTWTGRVSFKKYTCNLVALSLDLTSPTTHPIIWTVKKLPYDCFNVVPVAEPPGGALVFSPNHVLYFNQSAQYGLSLNHFGDDANAPFLYEKSKILLTLDTAKFVFLSAEDLLVSDKLGDLYIFHLVFDNRSVQNIEVMKIGASVLASDMCTLANEYLFIGSRLGDSLLIAYSKELPFEDQPAAGTTEPKETSDERPNKRRKITENGDFVADEEMQENEGQENNATQTNGATTESNDDADEAELMKLMKHSRIIVHDDDTAAGRAKKKNKGKRSRTARYKMAVCDTLPNIGPIADMTVHHSWDPASLSLLEDPNNPSLFEMVTCSGKNKNGALGVVHQGLRPEVIMSYELPNCLGMWSIKIAAAGATDTYHTHLVISKPNETSVFFGEALDDITKSTPFLTNQQTINVGTLGNGRHALQVHKSGLHLVDGSKVVQDVPITNEHTIVQSYILDPVVVVLLDNKTIQVFQYEQNQLKALDVLQPDVNKGNVSAVSLYKDMSFNNIFNQTNAELVSPEKDLHSSKTRKNKMDDIVDDVYNEMIHDMEFLEVYGDTFTTKSSADNDHNAVNTINKEKILRPIYLVLSRDNGTLELYRLPKFELVFLCPSLANGPQLLTHHNKAEVQEITDAEADVDAMEQDAMKTDGQTANGHGNRTSKFKLPAIVEIALHSFGEDDSTPYLIALLDDGDVYVYKGFYYSAQHHTGSKKKKKHALEESLLLRFTKVENQILFRNLKTNFDRAPDDPLLLIAREKLYTSSILRIHKFDDICGKKGFFLTGSRPVFILNERNYLRFHPMVIGGSVECFTPFNNVNCDHGFIYYNYKQKIHVSQLSQLFSYELPVPHYKMTNKTTVHNIVYQSQRKLDVLVVSERVNDQRLYVRKTKLGDEEDTEEGDPSVREHEIKTQMEHDFQNLDPRMPLVFEDRYEVRLVSADTKEVLDRFPLKEDEKEVVLTMKVCYLKNKNTDDETVDTVKRPILVCGTGYVRGENAVGMGRLLLFDIIQVHDDATDQSVFKLKLLYEKEDKGVMSVVASIEGYLLLAIGPKLYMYQLQNMNDLVGVAFFDAQIFITSCQTIKNYIMIGDMYKSIYFLRWKENSRTLTLLAKDVDHFNVESTEFLIDDAQLTMLFADYTSNLHMYQYIPMHKESRGGSRLLPVGNFHLGTRVHKFLRLNLNILKTTQTQTQKPNYKRSCIMYGGINGTMGYLAPLSEDRFKILGKLEMRLITVIDHYAGLNPKAFRLSKPFNKMSHNHLRHVLDGELLWKYTQLEKSKQFEIAQLIGTTPELIFDHLMEIDLSTFFF